MKIRIGGGSTVDGDIEVEAGARAVTVYLEDRSQVAGEVRNAEVVTR